MTLARAFLAECTKLRTLPATACLPPAMVVATVGLGATVGAACATGCDPARSGLSGVYLGQLAAVVLGVLVPAGECGATTLLAIPARSVAFATKALAVTAAVFPAAVLAVATALVVSGAPPAVVLRTGGGTVVYLVLVSLLALGVAATLRRTAAALAMVLGLLYVAPVAAQFVTDERWRTWIERAAPTPGGLATQGTTGPGRPLADLAVLAAWTAAALAAGAVTSARRDA